MSADIDNGPKVFYVQELFGIFKANCGGCHVENSLGGFHVQSDAEFPTKVTQKVLDRIYADDDTKRMPPGSKPIASRPEGDPVLKLAALIRLWLAQGSPSDSFTLPREESDAGAHSPYVLSIESGNGLTNASTHTSPGCRRCRPGKARSRKGSACPSRSIKPISSRSIPKSSRDTG